MRRIILGVNPEHGADDVARLGRLLSSVLDVSPIVVTALPWPGNLIDDESLRRLASAGTSQALDVVREELGTDEIDARVLPRHSPAEALHSLAETAPAVLIVLGSSHRGAIGRTLAGSVAESLLDGAPCGIVIAPRGYATRTEHRMHRIAVAFDGSPEAWTALETGIALTLRCHAELTVIVVAEPHYGAAAPWVALAAGAIQEAERAEKRQVLQLALRRAAPSLNAEGRLLDGDVGSQLAAQSDDFDLMIVGSRGFGPLRRTLLGSATRRLLHDSGCVTMVLPRGVGTDPLGLRFAAVPSAKHEAVA